MTTYYLAIDIGASNGRHILGSLQEGKLCLEEVYRFENGIKNENGTLAWDSEHLVQEVKNGIKRCKELGKIPRTVAIDTWGVDYVLLDEHKKEIFPAVSYRDSRTEAAVQAVGRILSQEELFAATGIQKQALNTIYQLYCDRVSGKLDKARYFLMTPDYLGFKLTGVIHNEYTEATTTNLINAETNTWDTQILGKLGIPESLFQPLSLPCTPVGDFSPEIQEEVGFNATVIHCPSHDTASAVAACPVDTHSMYVSSGTWSLVGTENTRPVLSQEAMEANFTNEGGIEYRYRFLKNIMGMWLFQSIRRDLDKKYTYDDMMHMAMESDFCQCIDPTDTAFLAPDNMIEAIRTSLGMPDLPVADLLSCVYHSLAHSYDKTVREIEAVCDKEIKAIHIVGGGSKDAYLNRLTSKITGKKVYVGLNEATAIGNLLSQVMADQKITLAQGREIVKNTFSIHEVTV